MATHVIAVVDDDPAILGLLDDLLGEEGYRMLAIPEGAEAPAIIARKMPDLVILDLWMEAHDTGWAVYNDLRADETTAHIPIIVCSADVGAIREHAAVLAARGDAAMEKPFDVMEMLATVARLLETARAGRTTRG